MSIFQPANDPNASGQNQSPLNDLVGDGKKFKTTDDLAKAKIESDRFIEKLQNEQREARETVARQQAELEALKAGRQPVESVTTPTQAPEQHQQQQPDITSEVERVLRSREQANTIKSNIETVVNKMTETYGSEQKAAEVIQRKAQELKTTPQRLQELASENPEMFFNLIGVDQKKPVDGPMNSSWNKVKNTAASATMAQGSTVQPGTYQYYQELRRSNPTAYFSPRVQLEMDKAAREAKARGVDFTTT